MKNIYTPEFAEAAEEFVEAAHKFLEAIRKTTNSDMVSYTPSGGWPDKGIVMVSDKDGVGIRVKVNRRQSAETKRAAQVTL